LASSSGVLYSDKTPVPGRRAGDPGRDEVILALDGSFAQDATALVAAEIGKVPHLDVTGLWEPPASYSPVVAGVIRCGDCGYSSTGNPSAASCLTCQRRQPRGSRLQLRESAPGSQVGRAVVNCAVTHSGDARLARHIGNATVRTTDNRGTRIYKEYKHSSRRIDLAVCAIMAHSVAATVSPVQLYWFEASSRGVKLW
jgi:hypothetical protein